MNIQKIRVLVVDDSEVMRILISSILKKESDFEIVGTAENGDQAFEMTKKLRPDIITMDLMMPVKNGFEATKLIMSECPTPIIILSSLIGSKEETESAVHALSLGALQVLAKDFDGSKYGFEERQKNFVENIRTLHAVKVVRRYVTVDETPNLPKEDKKNYPADVVAIGLSTGGPEAIEIIAKNLDDDYPVPIVVVLHISPGFIGGLVSLLQKKTTLKVSVASNNEELLPGHLYFAADNYNLLLKKVGSKCLAVLDDTIQGERFKPSITRLFESVAKQFPDRAIGGILTGMGSDGSKGLLDMREAGCFTFSQSARTCVVAGMPSEAKKIGAVTREVDLKNIASFLKNLV
ncbi:MAG: chemotaxis-specific protein-glutamate methyltransferase CheB [Legionellaceae bacterium]|nr:chemotaxis-specific protein-glutamate methyltransferase CheB [Legionellaceae bacterium]